MLEAAQRTIPATSAPAMPAFPVSVFHLGGGPVPTAPEDTPAPSTPTTKVDLAISYVKQYGEASRAELATAMGLESASHVKSFLKTPLEDGRLHADGDRYTIGTGQPQSRPRRARKTTRNAPERPRRSAQHHTPQTAAATAPPASATAPAAVAQILVGGIAISVRDDGGVLICANGSTVELSPAQAKIMRAFDTLLSTAAGVAA